MIAEAIPVLAVAVARIAVEVGDGLTRCHCCCDAVGNGCGRVAADGSGRSRALAEWPWGKRVCLHGLVSASPGHVALQVLCVGGMSYMMV